MTLKVTIVTGAFHELPPAGSGAVEKVWFMLARALGERGFDVTIMHKRSADHLVEEGGARVEKSVPVSGFAWSGSMLRNLAGDLVYSIRVLLRAPRSDVFVVNSWFLPILAPLFRGRLGLIWVHVARVPRLHYRFYRRADVLQPVSSHIAARLAGFPGLSEKTVVIGNPVDVSVFQPAPEAQPEPFRIVYTGRIHPSKGLEILVAAARILRRRDLPVSLLMVGAVEVSRGGGGEQFVQSLHDAAGDVSFQVVPAINDPEKLAEVLRSAAVYVYPTTDISGEASPMAPLESMSCGVPTIVSSLPQFRDYVRDGENALVFDHGRPDADTQLADAIGAVLQSRSLSDRLRENGRRTALELSTGIMADKYFSAMERACLTAKNRRLR